MSAPVMKFQTIEKVDRIYQILRHESHHGFPVVDQHPDEVCTKKSFIPSIVLNDV